MRYKILVVLAAVAVANASMVSSQTAKPAVKSKQVTASASTGKTVGESSPATVIAAKLPPGVPEVNGMRKTAFSLQYQDIEIGTGAEAEPYKIYKVHYTGWLAADGRKIDSSYDHRTALVDKDKKPILDADGKQKMSDPQPLKFVQGYGKLIAGWDQGFYGMRVGGKRRLFIPWQLAYGAKGRTTNDPKNPGVPGKADLIFDVELLEVSDLPVQVSRPTATTTPAQSAAPATTTNAAPAGTPATHAEPQTQAK
jgi:peptidylprolyl isomerase